MNPLKTIATLLCLLYAAELFPQATAVPARYKVWEDTSMIQLQWYLVGQRKLNDFKIFRSLQKKNNFIQLHAEHGFSMRKDTILFLVFDTTVTPNFAYDYYIVPVDENGRDLPKSEIISAKSYDISILPLVKRLKAVGLSDEKAIVLSWEVSPSPYLRNFIIYRSDRYEGPYTQIARVPPDQNQFTDKVQRGNENYYYYVVVNGPFGEGYPSAKVFGMFEAKEKPLPPQRLSADQSGNGVLLHWQPLDVLADGYYVFRAEGYTGELKLISSLIPPDTVEQSYLDTSGLEGGTVYSYAVATVGQGGLVSAYSERVSIIPDLPSKLMPPLNLKAKLHNDRVLLIWEDMTAYDPQVAGYNVYRKAGDKNYALLNSVPIKTGNNYYEDAEVKQGTTYEYVVCSVNISAKEGKKSAPVAITIPEILPPPPGGLLVMKTADGIVLNWNTLQENLKGFNIYRSENGAAFRLLNMVNADKKAFTDKQVSKGKIYVYQVTAVSKEGLESERSQAISLRY
ncbi:MAG: hypothetical protein KatS3mg031_1976 [Chitinophagales bacterium]|nr:MAG: hypothetical protein KatS3mg031_1976 [Chitinophagales bacterium]